MPAEAADRELQNAVTRTYAYGLERISEDQLIGGTWTPSFYGYDGHGSTRFLTNMAGSVTDTYNYDAFGNLINSTGTTPNNYLFAEEQPVCEIEPHTETPGTGPPANPLQPVGREPWDPAGGE